MREFLRTGKFGDIQLGDSIDKLKKTLGEPTATGGGSRRNRIPGIWKYGDVEFHLAEDRQRIWLIFCDAFEELQIGSTASIDRWFFQGHPACESVKKELSTARIPFRRLEMPHEPSAYLLRLDSGVELMFSTGIEPFMSPGCPGLFGFQLADKEAN